MSMPLHQLPHSVFTELATGGGGHNAMRSLTAAEYSKHVILLLGVLNSAQDSDSHASARVGYDLLAAAWHADRNAAEMVIRHPAVGVWARRTIIASSGGPAMPGAEPGGLRLVAAAAAIRAGLDAEIEVPVIDGWVMLPSLGAAVMPGHAAIVRSDNGHASVGPVEVPANVHRDAPGWLGLRRIRTGLLDVLIDDLDPFRMPDAPDLAPRLSDIQDWDAVLSHMSRVVEEVHPVVAAEIATAVSVIVPRSNPATGLVSTSSPEAFGAIAMSLPPDPITCAETFAHEIQHLKLGALLDMVQLALPDNGSRYYAPWRDDPRPLGGLLQGAYAYLGVSGFWRRQRQCAEKLHRADAEYARWRTATAEVVETIRSSGRLTPSGLEFVSGMAGTLSTWHDEPVPADAQEEAYRAADSHLTRWQSVNGPLPR